jgi:hypothetical protein
MVNEESRVAAFDKMSWNKEQRQEWYKQQKVVRSYQQEVVSKIEALTSELDISKYGELDYESCYSLFVLKTTNFNANNPTILITGGVHGYETSGVHGALRFLETRISDYTDRFNFIVAPCISPWGYETINRWNPDAIDPNRSFYTNSPSMESQSLMMWLSAQEVDVLAHFDLHETTDTDNSVFRPALASRDGSEHNNWNIPDGFYAVGDEENPRHDFQKAIIESVEKVTHIAPADSNGKLIGKTITQKGVINYPVKSIGLCAGLSNADYCTTTEVYPDSPKVSEEECIVAQVAAITGGLDYLVQNREV